MTQQKEHALIAALLAVGAIVAIYLYYKSSSPASDSTPIPAPDVTGAIAPYPNANPIKMGDITVGGSPTNITYNYQTPTDFQPVSVASDDEGAGGACCTDCSKAAGNLVIHKSIPASIMRGAMENLQTSTIAPPVTSGPFIYSDTGVLIGVNYGSAA